MHHWECRLAVLGLILLTGCKYDRVSSDGQIYGKYALTWVSADRFAYVPDKDAPFTFVRPGTHEEIRPKAMYTDGGSIPRELWSLRNYSPWTYGPAYLLHDWIFTAHDCPELPEYKNYTVESAAEVLAECMKMLMVQGKAPKSRLTFELIYDAVKTPIARQLWDQPSDCGVPMPMSATPGRFAHGLLRLPPDNGLPLPQSLPVEQYRIEVDFGPPPAK